MPPVCRTQGGTTILPAEDACIVSHPSDISRPLRSCSRKWPLTRRQSGALPFQRRRKARNCHRLYICKDRIFSEPPQEDKIGFFGPPRLIPTFSVPDRDNPTDGRKDTRATLPSGKNPSGQPAPPIIIRPLITDRKHFLYRQARRLLPFPATHPSLCPYAVPIAFDTGGRPPGDRATSAGPLMPLRTDKFSMGRSVIIFVFISSFQFSVIPRR